MSQKIDIQRIPDRDKNDSFRGPNRGHPNRDKAFLGGNGIGNFFFQNSFTLLRCINTLIKEFIKNYFELCNLFHFGFVQFSKHLFDIQARR